MDKLNLNLMLDEYKNLYNEFGYSPSSLGCPKGRQSIRFQNAYKFLNNTESVLDFGCGFGDFFNYLKTNNKNIQYFGFDLMEEFIIEAKSKYPDGNFNLIKPFQTINLEIDTSVAFGTFNYLYSENEETHFEAIKKIIKQLWSISKKNLIIDFQSEYVDFKQPNAYHQNLDSLINFLNKNISRRIKIDYSYMPFEFMICVYKDLNLSNQSTFLNEI